MRSHSGNYYSLRADVLVKNPFTSTYRLTEPPWGDDDHISVTYRPAGWNKMTQIRVRFKSFYYQNGRDSTYIPHIEVLARQVDERMKLLGEKTIYKSSIRAINRACPFCNHKGIVMINGVWICGCGFNYTPDSCKVLMETDIRRGVKNPMAFQTLTHNGDSFVVMDKYVL